MRITIAAIGKLKAEAERGLVQRYLERAEAAGPRIGLSFAVRELSESRAGRDTDRRREEAEALRAAIPAGAAIVALDERGRSLSSDAFATLIGQRRNDGAADLAFLIGGPDGLDPGLVAEAATTIAFGAMSWPHQLARAMLAEQLYRAVTILSGHPYHRR